MTFQPGAQLYTAGFGIRAESVEVPHIDTRAPGVYDIYYPIGKKWIYVNNGVYELLGLTTFNGVTTANWIQVGSSSGDVLAVNGTTNQVTASTTSGVVTLSIPSTFTAPGSITAASGNLTASNGNLDLATPGNKLVIATGTNASVGTTSAMSGTPGTITVSTTACTTSSVILFSRNITGGTPGQVSITAQSAGSFTLTSTGNETSTFNYVIIN